MTRLGWVSVLAAATACSTFAFAQNADVEWLRKPTPEELRSVWPANAKGSGRGVIRCTVTIQGGLRACQVVSETPAGQGFGGAAVALAPQFMMKPKMVNGRPQESLVEIPISFTCDDNTGNSHLRVGCGSQPGDGRRRLISGLSWGTVPTFDDVLAAYPEKAKAKKVGGVVSLTCHITGQGTLNQCDILSEQPLGMGFGAAARKLSARFSQPASPPDRPLKGMVTQLAFTFDAAMLDGGRAVTKPRWARGPDMAQALALYPKEALAEGVTKGQATMRCQVTATGELAQCAPVAETPAGKGFAAAGAALMPSFRLRTWSDSGLPVVGGTIRVPVVFQLQEREGQKQAAAGG